MKKIYILFLMLAASIALVNAQGTWTRKADFIGAARFRAVRFTINDQIYYGTGNVISGSPESADFYKYDIASDTWTPVANLPKGMQAGIGFSVGGKGYAGIGWLNGNGFSDLYEYDTSLNSWVPKASWPGPLTNDANSFVLNGMAYVGGGDGPYGNPTISNFYQFDPVANSWVQKANIPIPGRRNAGTFTIGNYGYLGGGGNDDLLQVLDDYYRYDPVNNQWTPIVDFPIAAESRNCGFAFDGDGYSTASQLLNKIYKYNLFANQWSLISVPPYINFSADMSEVVGNKVYFLRTSTNEFWEWDPNGISSCLVAHYPFTGNAADSSITGNNAAVNGATLTTDRFGNSNSAYAFNGLGDYIDAGDVTYLDGLSEATWNWWMSTNDPLPRGAGNDYVSVFRKDSSWIPMQFANDGYDYWRSLLFTGGAGSANLIWGLGNSGVVSYLGDWAMYTVVKTFSELKYYRNGVLQQSIPYTGILENKNAHLLFGRAYTDNTLESYNGKLDDIRIYSCAISEEEITTLFNDCSAMAAFDLPDTLSECGNAISLDAGANYSSYSWNTGSTSQTLEVFNSGMYRCTVTQGSCSVTDSVYVNIINANILQNDTTICLGASLNLCSNNALFLSGTPNPGLGGYATVSNISSILPTGSAKTYECAFRLNQSVPSGNNMGLWAFGPDPLQDCKAFGLKISSSQCGSNKLWLWGHNCPEFCGPTVQINHDYRCFVVVTGNNVKLYLDGVLEMDVTMNLSGVISDKYFIGLGWDSYNFQGYIDDVKIWNFPWSQTDVTNAFSSCLYPSNSNLISGWDFNQSTLNQVVNIKSNIDDIDFNINCSLQAYSSSSNCNSGGASTYLWSTGEATSSIEVTPTQTATYYLTVSNGSFSCTDSVEVTVSNNSADLFVQDTVAACGDSTILDAGSGFSSYLWSTGATNQTITVFNGGWFKCTVNQNSCSSTDSVFVSLIHADITQNDTTIIGGNPVNLNVQTLSSQFSGQFTLITSLGDSSYYISNDNHSWFEAKELATSYSGHLATLTSYREDTAVSNRIQNMYSNGLFPLNQNAFTGECYIGLSQNKNSASYIEPNGGWEWVTGEVYSYSGWYPGEPNNNTVNSEYGSTNWQNTSRWNDLAPGDGGVNGAPHQFIYEMSDVNITLLWSTGETTSSIVVNPCETTTYYVTVSNGVSSCTDSVKVNTVPSVPSITEVSICQGQTYVFNGVSYSSAGTYSTALTNANGCDSIATLILEINETAGSLTTVSECDSYTWNGQTYTQSGNYYYSVPLGTGCDSVATLNLTINHPSNSSISHTACESYTWNGQTYSQSGTYSYSGTNSVGCDSTATLNLTINHTSSSLTTINACGNYTWNGLTYSSSGSYYYNSINVAGCDSTATLNLTINTLSIAANSIGASATIINPGSAVTLSVNGGTLGTSAMWKWYSGSCGGVLVGTGPSISVNPMITTSYFVQAQGLCNTTTCVAVVVTVSSAICGPTGIISNAINNSICSGTNVTLTVQGVLGSGASWKWYKGGCGSHTSIGSGSSINVSPTSTTTYYVRSQGGSCGTSSCVSITISVLSRPSMPGSISGISSGLCNRTGVVYSVSSVSGATSYVWSVPVGATIASGQGANSIVVNYGTTLGTNGNCGSRSICVKAVNACGNSALRCISISLIPTISCSVSGPSTVCRNQVVTYSITASTNASSYSWVVPSGWTILSGQGTLSIIVRVGNTSGTISVTASNPCGVSSAASKYVTKRNCSREEDDDSDLIQEISLYPNPVSGHLFLDAGGYQAERIEIFDVLGNVLDRMGWTTEIDLSGYQSGLYFIRIYTDDSVILKRIEVAH